MANQFKFEIPGSVKPTAAYPTDYYYGPWTSTTEALVATTGTRYLGQTVCVITNGSAHKYIFQSGTTDSDLVLESSGSIDGAFLSLSGGAVSGDTSFSGRLSAETYYSGSTRLDSLFATPGDLTTKASLTGATFTGGIFAPTLSAATYYSGATLLETVINSIATGATAAGSGLSKTGNTLELGGLITHDTTFSSNTYNFDIHSKLKLDNSYGFNYGGVGFNDQTICVVPTSDGKFLVGGGFITYNGVPTGRIVRVLADGAIDPTFSVGPIGFFNSLFPTTPALTHVNAIAIQTDGKILVAGYFNSFNGTACSAGIARLNSDGSYDTTFNFGGVGCTNPYGITMILLPSGKILLAGSFATYNGVSQGGLVRINTNGSLDTTFNTSGVGFGGSSSISVLSLQSDGKIICGNVFTSYNGVANSTRLIRINTDGTQDTTFNVGGTGFNNFVNSLYILPDDKMLLGGAFTTFNNVSVGRFVRLNANGSLDNTLNIGTGFNGTTYGIDVQSSGKYILGGGFTTYNGNTVGRILRMNTDGTIDSTFNAGSPGFDSFVNFAKVLSDDSMIALGFFTSYNGVASGRIAKIGKDGAIDITTNQLLLNGDGALRYAGDYSSQYTDRTLVDKGFVVSAITSIPTGNYLSLSGGTVSGDTNFIGDISTTGNTSLSTTYPVADSNTGFSEYTNTVAYQPDGKILVGSDEAEFYNGISIPKGLCRLNSDNTIDTTFNTGGEGFNNSVYGIAVQLDGKIIVGGWFTTYNGVACPQSLVRLNSDGTLDTTFNNGGTGFDNGIFSLIIQSDGKIIIVGGFNTYNGVDCPDRLVRINSDGTLDTTFNTGGAGFNSTAFDLTIQSDGKILIGGAFTTYNGVECSYRMVRLNSDGSIDPTFNVGGSGFDGNVWELKTQSDDKIIVGGTFTTYNGVSCSNYIVRLNTDGSIDSTFNSGGSGFDNGVFCSAILPNDQIVVGGYFTTYNGNPCSAGVARLNSDGTIDSTFNIGGFGIENNDGLDVLVVQPDGVILGVGWFTDYNGSPCPANFLKLTPDGKIAPTSYQNAKVLFDGAGALRYEANYHDQYTDRTLVDKEYVLDAIASAPPGNYLSLSGGTVNGDTNFIGETNFYGNAITNGNASTYGNVITNGNVTTYGNVSTNGDTTATGDVNISGDISAVGNTNFYGDLLLNKSYTIPISITGTGFNAGVSSFAIQSDGKIIVGGDFDTYNGVACQKGLVRLNTDNSIDPTFNPSGTGSNSYVFSLAIQSDGKIIVGGLFTSYNGVDCPDYLIRLNSDGTIDETFNLGGTGFNNYVLTVAIQTDGKILAAGYINTYNGVTCSYGLARINSDGSLDTTFNVGGIGFDGSAQSMAFQSDGKILVGGSYFSNYNGVNCPDNFVRLNVDGTIDSTFNPGGTGFNSVIQDIVILSDGKIIVGGPFSMGNGIPCPRIARLNSDGTIDTTFNPGGSGFNTAVSSITLQPDGKLIVSGAFKIYNGVSCSNGLVRLNSNGSLDTTFNNGGAGIDADVATIASSAIEVSGTILISGNFSTYNDIVCPSGFLRLNPAGSLGDYHNITVLFDGPGALRYDENYHAEYTDRSLVDKEFVIDTIASLPAGNYLSLSGGTVTGNTLFSANLSAATFYSGSTRLETVINSIATGATSAANGITKTGSTFELGGIFTHDTVLTGDTYNFDVYSKLSLNNKHGGFNISGTGFDSQVSALYLQSDGKVLVGGAFDTYNGLNCSDRLVRLNTNGTIDPVFNSGSTGFAGGDVASIEIQSDGKYIVGGSFNSYNGISAGRLVRLFADGTIDSTFNSGGTGFNNGPISSLIIQPDGKILVGGYFQTFNGVNCPDNLVRLTTGGTIDSTFNFTGTGFNSDVKQLAIQPDGKIIVAGAGTTYNGVNCPDFLVRLNTNGTLDTSFNTGGVGFNNNFALAVKVLSDGKILVSGNFTAYNGVACNGCLARLNSDGSIDPTFNVGGIGIGANDGSVNEFIIQPDGKILIIGSYTQYNGIRTNGITRLNSNGTLDSTWDLSGSVFGNYTSKVAIQPDGKIIVGGSFTTVNGVPNGRLVRLNSDGTVDTYTNTKVLLNGNGSLRYEDKYHKYYTSRSLVDKEYADNNLLASNGLSIVDRAAELGGALTKNTIINGNYNLSFGNTSNEINNLDVYSKISLNNKKIAFNSGGTGFNSVVYSTSVQADGKIFVGGQFTLYNGVDCSDKLVRLTTGGTIDSTFNSGGTGFVGTGVLSTAVQVDGKILAGGIFTTYNGVNCPDNLVRLTTGGTIDSTFNLTGTGFNATVSKTVIQSDGNILAGGSFTLYNGVDCSDYLVRLTTGGTIDSTWNTGGAGFNSSVQSIAIQSDGKVLVGGQFTLYNGVNCSDYLVRLTTGGTIDSTFNLGGLGFSGSSATVSSITIQSDGKILVGGQFVAYNGVDCSDYLVRLNSDGSIDSTWNTGGIGFNGGVRSISIQSDGKILVGGLFVAYNGVNCHDYLVRLTTGGTIDSTFNVGGTGFNDSVQSIFIQSDGKILIGGNFTTYNGVNCPDRLVRLFADGSIESNNVKVLLDGPGALRYESRYHDEYTDRTLVDREYVLSAIAGISGGSSSTGNYLSLSGGTVTGNTNFSANLSATTLYSGATNVSNLFARTVHTHAIADVTGLQTELNNKANLTGATFTGGISAPSISATTLFSGATNVSNLFARTVHTHAIADVIGLQTQLNTKADLTGTTAALNGYIKLDGSSTATTGNLILGDTFGLSGKTGGEFRFDNGDVLINGGNSNGEGDINITAGYNGSKVNLIGGNGEIFAVKDGSIYIEPSSGANGSFFVKTDNASYVEFDVSNILSSRSVIFQDKDYTGVADLSDIVSTDNFIALDGTSDPTTGDILIGSDFGFIGNNGGTINFDSAGSLHINAAAGGYIDLNTDGGSIILNDTGELLLYNNDIIKLMSNVGQYWFTSIVGSVHYLKFDFNSTTEDRDVVWQDKDYTGVADLSDLDEYIRLDGTGDPTTGFLLIGDDRGLLGETGEEIRFTGGDVEITAADRLTIMSNVIFINESPVAPDPGLPPANGGYLFVENYTLKWMDINGIVTDLTPAP